MPIFLVAYELSEPGESGDRLAERLEEFSSCRALETLWFVEALGPAEALRELLMPYLDDDDTVFVDPVTDYWAGFNMPNCGSWLNDHER